MRKRWQWRAIGRSFRSAIRSPFSSSNGRSARKSFEKTCNGPLSSPVTEIASPAVSGNCSQNLSRGGITIRRYGNASERALLNRLRRHELPALADKNRAIPRRRLAVYNVSAVRNVCYSGFCENPGALRIRNGNPAIASIEFSDSRLTAGVARLS